MADKPEIFHNESFDDDQYFKADGSAYEQYNNILENNNVPQYIKDQLIYAAKEDIETSYKQVLQRAKEYTDGKTDSSSEKAQQQLDSAPDLGKIGGQCDVNTTRLLNTAEPGYGSYCQWIHEVWNAAPIVTPKDYNKAVVQVFYQNDRINFSALMKEAEDLKNAQEQLDGSMDSVRAGLNRLFDSWTGPAAQAASNRWESGIVPAANELSTRLEDAYSAIPEVLNEVHQVLKDQVQTMLNNEIVTEAGARLGDAAAVARVATQGDASSSADLARVAPFLNIHFNYAGDGDHVSDAVSKEVEGYIEHDDPDQIVPFCIAWCEEFVKAFQKRMDRFNQDCQNAVDKISQQWDVLQKHFDALENTFADVPSTPSVNATPGPSAASGSGNGSGSVGTPSVGGGGGGGGAGGVTAPTPSLGAGPGQGSGPMAMNADSGSADERESEAELNPVTGEPLKINPETGEPYPIDPETGEAITDLGEEQETLTVNHGDREITMSEPNDSGEMSISIDNGSGPPMEFSLDFTLGDVESVDGLGAGSGAAAPDGPLTGQGQGSFGPQGTFGPQGSAFMAEEPAYRPDPDGVIRIEEEGMTITAERPEGADGPTVVTIDDGSGEPTSYTLGEETQQPRPWSDGSLFDNAAGAGGLAADDPEGGNHRPDGSAFTGGPPNGDGGAAAASGASASASAPSYPQGVSDSGAGTAGPTPAQAESAAGASASSESGTVGDQQTSAQGLFAGGLGDSGSGVALGADVGGAQSSGFGLGTDAATTAASTSAQGSAGLGAAPGGGSGSGGDENSSSTSMRGMGMMGAGMAGAGGQGGEDEQRDSNGFLIAEKLFDFEGEAGILSRISGSLDDDS